MWGMIFTLQWKTLKLAYKASQRSPTPSLPPYQRALQYSKCYLEATRPFLNLERTKGQGWKVVSWEDEAQKEKGENTVIIVSRVLLLLVTGYQGERGPA